MIQSTEIQRAKILQDITKPPFSIRKEEVLLLNSHEA